MKYNIIIPALLLITCCSPRIYPVQRDTVTLIRTETREVLKDTTVYVTLPQDSTAVTTRDTSSVLRIRAAISEASVKEGMLHHSLYSDPSYTPEVKIQYKDRIEYRDTTIYVTNRDAVEVEKKLNGWQKVMMAGGYVLMGIIAATVVIFILRMRRKI